MTSSSRHFFYLKISATTIAAVTFLLFIFAMVSCGGFPDLEDLPTLSSVSYLHPKASGIADADWSALRPGPDSQDSSGSLSRRFRLAGTMFKFGDETIDEPWAILDDKLLVTQCLVKRGDEVAPGIRLVKVGTESVTLDGPGGMEVIQIEYIGGGVHSAASDVEFSSSETEVSSDPASRFGGRQVFPGRWEFDRRALIDYYGELRDEPERLLAVFDSLEPLWQDNDPSTKRINGYTLNVRGEAPLFEAMGMKQGDVVRSVNSLPMTNRRRAESFIKSFVEDSENTFVLELERGGTISKQVYIIR